MDILGDTTHPFISLAQQVVRNNSEKKKIVRQYVAIFSINGTLPTRDELSWIPKEAFNADAIHSMSPAQWERVLKGSLVPSVDAIKRGAVEFVLEGDEKLDFIAKGIDYIDHCKKKGEYWEAVELPEIRESTSSPVVLSPIVKTDETLADALQAIISKRGYQKIGMKILPAMPERTTPSIVPLTMGALKTSGLVPAGQETSSLMMGVIPNFSNEPTQIAKVRDKVFGIILPSIIATEDEILRVEAAFARQMNRLPVANEDPLATALKAMANRRMIEKTTGEIRIRTETLPRQYRAMTVNDLCAMSVPGAEHGLIREMVEGKALTKDISAEIVAGVRKRFEAVLEALKVVPDERAVLTEAFECTAKAQGAVATEGPASLIGQKTSGRRGGR